MFRAVCILNFGKLVSQYCKRLVVNCTGAIEFQKQTKLDDTQSSGSYSFLGKRIIRYTVKRACAFIRITIAYNYSVRNTPRIYPKTKSTMGISFESVMK